MKFLSLYVFLVAIVDQKFFSKHLVNIALWTLITHPSKHASQASIRKNKLNVTLFNHSLFIPIFSLHKQTQEGRVFVVYILNISVKHIIQFDCQKK